VAIAMSASTAQVDSRTFQDFLDHNPVAVVDFYADWCGPCRIVSPVIERLAGEYDGKAKFAKLDVDASSSIAGKFGVTSIPTLIIFKNGRPVDRIIGAAPVEHYRSKIGRVL